MGLIIKRCFPKASQVTDRFHVQKLACDALQDMRIAFRWKAIEQENKERYEQLKEQKYASGEWQRPKKESLKMKQIHERIKYEGVLGGRHGNPA